MANDAGQNPANKWGRYSGAGEGGISEVIPTEAEARRGLEPFRLGGEASTMRAAALGLTALLGAVVAGVALRQTRQQRHLPTRVLRRVGIR